MSKCPKLEPPVPCEITISGNALPFTGALIATLIVVGPIDTGLAMVWLGYQMPITIGLRSWSAALPCWKPAAWTPVPASRNAIAATADNRFDLLIFMGRQPVVESVARLCRKNSFPPDSCIAMFVTAHTGFPA